MGFHSSRSERRRRLDHVLAAATAPGTDDELGDVAPALAVLRSGTAAPAPVLTRHRRRLLGGLAAGTLATKITLGAVAVAAVGAVTIGTAVSHDGDHPGPPSLHVPTPRSAPASHASHSARAHAHPTETPPGQTITPPGQAATPPGQAKRTGRPVPPGQTKTPRGQTRTPPGQATRKPKPKPSQPHPQPPHAQPPRPQPSHAQPPHPQPSKGRGRG